MAFTRVVGPGIHTQSNINSHNIKSTGIITATKFDGPFDSINVSGAATFTGSVTIGGTLTYEDVTNIDSVGLITARKGIISSGVVTATAFHGASQIGIQSAGTQIGAGITQLNFIGAGNTFAVSGTTVAISIAGGGGGSGAFTTSVTGIQTTSQIVGIGTTSTDDADLQGIGNSARGMYVSNGMILMDNLVSGTTVDISIAGGGGGSGAGFSTSNAGLHTTSSIGVNTSALASTLTGVGNSFQGIYVSNGMMIMDNTIHGNHYIGTNFNGLMVGPVNIEGTISIDGNYVVV